MLPKCRSIGFEGLDRCEVLRLLGVRLMDAEREAEKAFEEWNAARGTPEELSLWEKWKEAKRVSDDLVRDLNDV